MYPVVLGLHNLVRWVVVAAGVWAVVLAWQGLRGRSGWTRREAGAAQAFVLALDVQLLLGILLYAVFSPLTRDGMRDMAVAMRDPAVRYFLVEHVVIMLSAVVLAHVGAVRIRRAVTDAARFQQAAIWLGLALAVVLGFIPWARPLVPSF